MDICRFRALLIVPAILCLLFSTGCQNNDAQNATAQSSDQTSAAGKIAGKQIAAEKSSGEPDNNSLGEKKRVSPELDENAVNEEGLVVLQSVAPVEPSAEPTETALEIEPTIPPTQQADIVLDLPARPVNAVIGTPTLAESTPVETSTDNRKKGGLPVEANVATDSERNQTIAEDWPQPQAVLFVSGQQHGYLEPCGCTGLDKQKGGLIRRDTLLTALRARDWEIIPLDVGNQVRRIGRQPELKFQSTVEAFNLMNYSASTLGVDDLKLSSVELIQAASTTEADKNAFVTCNVTLLDPSFFPDSRIIEAGGRKIGVTGALGLEYASEIQSSDIEVADPLEKLPAVITKLEKEGCDFIVLLAHASREDSAMYAQKVPGIDLVVTAGGFGEPTLRPEPIDGSEAVMVQVGTKGMYGGIVGLFDDEENPIRYQKIAISSQFKDSERMLVKFADYQTRLKEAGFEGLGVRPVAHPTGRKFVGSETCGDCHTTAYEIWEGTPHYHATESIVNPPNDRGGIQRHFDPECVSCHVTGWNAQRYYPYQTGYISLEQSSAMLGNGCENCHGPGAEHSAAEYGDIEADTAMLEKLREQMKLPLDRARDKCLECHDLDNSPDFHETGAFDEYWDQVKHYGKD